MVGVAVNVVLVPEQIEVADAAMLTDDETVGVTLIIRPRELTVDGLAQVKDDVITTLTTSPSASVAF